MIWGRGSALACHQSRPCSAHGYTFQYLREKVSPHQGMRFTTRHAERCRLAIYDTLLLLVKVLVANGGEKRFGVGSYRCRVYGSPTSEIPTLGRTDRIFVCFIQRLRGEQVKTIVTFGRARISSRVRYSQRDVDRKFAEDPLQKKDKIGEISSNGA